MGTCIAIWLGTGSPLFIWSYRDDWAMRHFLHPKLLRKSREVRAQLEDIMKFQKMNIISAGTDFDVIRYASRAYSVFMYLITTAEKRLLQAISIKPREWRELASLLIFVQVSPRTSIPRVHYTDLDVRCQSQDHHIRMTDLFFLSRYAFICHLPRTNPDIKGIYDASYCDWPVLARWV